MTTFSVGDRVIVVNSLAEESENGVVGTVVKIHTDPITEAIGCTVEAKLDEPKEAAPFDFQGQTFMSDPELGLFYPEELALLVGE